MSASNTIGLLRWGCLLLLVLQNTSTILLIRYVRTQPGDLFLSTTAIACQDLIKISVSVLMVLIESNGLTSGFNQIYKLVIRKPIDLLKTSLPALIYTIQSNLIYVAISHLDAAVFQVTSQIKILTTAFFMATMLKRTLNMNQIISLVMLFCGVSMIQLQNIKYLNPSNDDEKNAVLGLICVILASVLSGFAGVYIEKILKSSSVSLWIRNIQLSLLGSLFSVLTVYTYDAKSVNKNGFFFGYNSIVWINILVQSAGGLLVAVVMKYADNILKGFATSIAIIFSCMFSVYLFDTRISTLFIFGTLVVILSVIFYSYTPQKVQTIVTILPTSIQDSNANNEQK